VKDVATRGDGISAPAERVALRASQSLGSPGVEIINRPPPSSRSAWSSVAWTLFHVGVCGVAALAVAANLGRLGWGWELSSHFRVQYGALLALAAVCYLAFGRRWRPALAAGLLSAVNLCLVVPVSSPPPLARGRHALRLVESNVYANNYETSRVIDFVRAAKPDIFLAIEVNFRWAEALEALQADFPYRRVVPAHHAHGLAIYSRVPLEDVEELRLGDPNFSWAFRVRFTLDGERVTLFGAHPYSPINAHHLEDRNRQLADLAALVRAEPGPTIVLGDLNVSPWSPYFQDFLTATRLIDSRRAFGIQATWPANAPPLGIPIDHCLVSRELAVNARMVGPRVGSDHLPIIIDLSLAEPAPEAQ